MPPTGLSSGTHQFGVWAQCQPFEVDGGVCAQEGLAQEKFGVGRQSNGRPSVERRTKQQMAGRLTGCLHRVGRARPSNAGHPGWF